MKRSLLLILACSLLAAGQQTITITVTVPNAVAKVADAWRQTQCVQTDAKGACIQLRWDSLKAMVQDLTAQTLNAKLLEAFQWAIENADVSLPSPVKVAVETAKSAKATIDAAVKTSAGTVQ